jgi:hypothetical protein
LYEILANAVLWLATDESAATQANLTRVSG